MCRRIFGVTNSIVLKPIISSILLADCPGDTSPGVTYRKLGFQKKADALPLVQHVLLSMYRRALSGEELDDDLLWLIAGRPKLIDIQSAYNKVIQKKGLARAVWVSDMEEPILSRHFTGPIRKGFTGIPGQNKIMIGFEKGHDHVKLQDWVSDKDYFLNY
ncbi:uncharacterized protein V1513DRAFT_436793, partial [Lipomyces chichibuensis]|uniref:uncharacterized protein n=1 Tax=Lipomyces chichibuensis TaxID=1546026 RepID=UPI0033436F75